MKHFVTTFACVLVLLGCAASAFAADCVLVREGRPDAVIVIADQPDDIALSLRPHRDNDIKEPVQLTTRYAADQLQRYIKKASGAELPIVAASKAPAEGTLVLVGGSKLVDRLKLQRPTRPEGIRMVHFPRGIALLGETTTVGERTVDRSTLLAVYALLDKLGFRFYFYGEDPSDELGEVIPTLKTVTVDNGMAFDEAPDFPFRSGFVTGSFAQNHLAVRVNRNGNTTGFYANHTDQTWGGAFRKQHPEAFVMLPDGARSTHLPCYSHPKTLELRLQLIDNFYKDGSWKGGWVKPNDRYIPFVIIDNYHTPCRCARCMADYAPELGRYGRISTIIFKHTVALANEAKKRWPGKRISTLAYSHYMLPPAMDIPENVDIQVATMWSTKLNQQPGRMDRNVELLKSWSKKLGGKRERLFVWSYGCWPGGSVPYIFPHVQQQWFRRVKPLIQGEFINPGQPTAVGHYMNYVWSRLMWDVDADVDAMLADYAEKFFGPAAQPMQRFYTVLIDRYEKTAWSVELPTWHVPNDLLFGETYTAPVVAELRKCMEEAKAKAAKGSIYARRIEFMEKGFASFFRTADLCHQTLGHVAELAFGEGKPATVELKVDRPELDTRVTMQRVGERIRVTIDAGEPGKLHGDDRFVIAFYPDGKLGAERPIVNCNTQVEMEEKFPQGAYTPPPVKRHYMEVDHRGLAQGNLDAGLESHSFADGKLTMTLSFPASKLGYAGKPMELPAQFSRTRMPRKGEYAVTKDRRGRAIPPRPKTYVWVAQLVPPWPEYAPRYGRVRIE